jgi:hypothetical protein
MKIKLSDIKPSPYNPKEPFTKKQLSALKRHVEKHDFLRDLLVCRDFDTGEGFYCLDGHTAIDILKELGREDADCRVVETVTNKEELIEFISGYAISKKPLYNEIYKSLGARMEEITGKSITFYNEEAKEKLEKTVSSAVHQTQYFLTLPEDCVSKLKSFVKTKAYKANKTEAIAQKIDQMNEEQFLENVFQIIL